MSTLKVGIATPDEMRSRTLAIARREMRAVADNPKAWFTSPESFAKVLSNKNRAFLELIATTHPQSPQEIAEKTGRKASNLSQTLQTMEQYGFVHLHSGPRGQVRPDYVGAALRNASVHGVSGATDWVILLHSGSVWRSRSVDMSELRTFDPRAPSDELA